MKSVASHFQKNGNYNDRECHGNASVQWMENDGGCSLE